MNVALKLYYIITALSSPFIALYLQYRKFKGKEDPERIKERFGHASAARPESTLWWLHAASVGEAVSLRPLIDEINTHAPHVTLLLTTGTVSSATMLIGSLPKHVIHQYIPIDTPAACKKFIEHWQPNIGIFTESELWPNLITHAHGAGVHLALINARMSDRSFSHWQLLDQMASSLLGCFSFIAAQTKEDGARYTQLGGKDVKQLGHLKQDAKDLPADPAEISRWQERLSDRPCIVAASFHKGEAALIGAMQQALKSQIPNLCTILVPRHPPRAPAMKEILEAKGIKTQLRSEGKSFDPEAQIYIADTIGEMGLWYRLADVVVMGGSFIEHGGQNPLEAIRLGRAVIMGPHHYNFEMIVRELDGQYGIVVLKTSTPNELISAAAELLTDDKKRKELNGYAKHWLAASPPVAKRLTDALLALDTKATL